MVRFVQGAFEQNSAAAKIALQVLMGGLHGRGTAIANIKALHLLARANAANVDTEITDQFEQIHRIRGPGNGS